MRLAICECARRIGELQGSCCRAQGWTYKASESSILTGLSIGWSGKGTNIRWRRREYVGEKREADVDGVARQLDIAGLGEDVLCVLCVGV